jgi:hypothetical protein
MLVNRCLFLSTFIALFAIEAVAHPQVPEPLAALQSLSPAGLPSTARFGFALDVGDGLLVVGAPRAQGSSSGSTNGSAFVYERDAGGHWSQVQRLLPPDWANEFGYDVAISGDRIVIGSWQTGAWVYDRAPNGEWVENTWLGLLPSPGGSVVDVEDGVVVCRRNAAANPFHFPGFTIWEEQLNGSWSQPPIGAPSGGGLGGDSMNAVNIAIDNGVVVTSHADWGWSCLDMDPSASGTHSWVCGPSGWIGVDTYFEFSEGSLTAMALDGDFLAIGGSRREAPLFPSSGACSPGSYDSFCGDCVYARVEVTNGLGTASNWSKVSLSIQDPHHVGFSVDVRGSRVAYLAIDAQQFTRLVVAQLPPSTAGPFAVAYTTAMVTDPILTTSQISTLSALNQDVRLDEQHIFVAKYDHGPGVVRVFGKRNFLASSATASLSLASDVNLVLDAGLPHAGQPYMILGSATGTAPGVDLVGDVTIPLVVDGYTHFTLAGAPHIVNQVASLDVWGKAFAQLDLPPGLPPALAGLTIHHAFVWLDATTSTLRASVPVSTLLIP